jgi:hypothetical protein
MSMSLEDLSRKMKELEVAMRATHTGGGAIGSPGATSGTPRHFFWCRFCSAW